MLDAQFILLKLYESPHASYVPSTDEGFFRTYVTTISHFLAYQKRFSGQTIRIPA